MTLVGDFDRAGGEKLAATLFGDWKSPGKFARVPYEYKPVDVLAKTIATPDKANAYFTAECR